MAIKIEGGTTVAGNAVGFTAKAETVVVRRISKQRAYRVSVHGQYGPSATDPRTQTFPTIGEARDYAATLVDEGSTLMLAWWPVKVA